MKQVSCRCAALLLLAVSSAAACASSHTGGQPQAGTVSSDAAIGRRSMTNAAIAGSSASDSSNAPGLVAHASDAAAPHASDGSTALADAGQPTPPPNPNLTRGLCTEGGWCWVDSLPQGRNLHGVFAAGDKMWAVGDNGTILLWDGARFSFQDSGVTGVLYAIWGSSANDLWACGDSGVLHGDGSRWSATAWPAGSGCLAVSGSSSSDVWFLEAPPATSLSSKTLHWDGTTFEESPGAPSGATKLWASSASDAWEGGGSVVGLQHYDGSSWKDGNVDNLSLWQVWGLSKQDVWAVGDTGTPTALHYDGSSWTATPLATNDAEAIFGPMWGTATNDVYTFSLNDGELERWNGSAWSTSSTLPGSPEAVSVASATAIWGVGEYGQIIKGSGDTWNALSQSLQLAGGIRQLVSLAPDDVWMLGNQGDVDHWDGASWVKGSVQGLVDWISGSPKHDVWVHVTSPLPELGEVQHYDGTSWQQVPSAPWPISGFWAYSPTEAWATTKSATFHWDGMQWMMVAGEQGGRVVWGRGPNDVWVGGDAMKPLRHYDGNAWSDFERPSLDQLVHSISGTSPSDVWLVVGSSQTDAHTFHWDGSVWNPADRADGSAVMAIWAVSSTNAYGACPDAIVHWDGSNWTSMGKGTSALTG